MLITPAGTASPMTSMSLRIDHGVGDAGLTMVQLPAASAGAIFHAAISSGKLNGMIWATTPSGSWNSYEMVLASISVLDPSHARVAADHFRYFAAATRAWEGSSTEIDAKTISYEFHEPLGVVAQIIPFNFPLLMAAWKIAPALAAGNCTIVKPASPTPWSILKLMEVIGDAVPAGVINILTGPGASMGKALATSPRIAKIGFTGETTTGKLMMHYAAENIIPVTAELGGKSPNIFFSDVMAHDDAFLDKAVEGLVLFAFNKGEVCTCPSRALVQADIYDAFMERVLVRMKAIKQGNPLDTETMVGPQVSIAQLEKISGYVDIGRGEGCEVLTGGAPATMAAPYDGW